MRHNPYQLPYRQSNAESVINSHKRHLMFLDAKTPLNRTPLNSGKSMFDSSKALPEAENKAFNSFTRQESHSVSYPTNYTV